jgi:hypothetical protein
LEELNFFAFGKVNVDAWIYIECDNASSDSELSVYLILEDFKGYENWSDYVYTTTSDAYGYIGGCINNLRKVKLYGQVEGSGQQYYVHAYIVISLLGSGYGSSMIT